MSCAKATGVAKKMRDQFGPALDVQMHLVESEAAKHYQLRGSTTVFVNDEWVPLETALSEDQMAAYLRGRMAERPLGSVRALPTP
jgi:hypothetical protein